MLSSLSRLSPKAITAHQQFKVFRRSRRLLVGTTNTGSTYYDSQSGMTVPLHDEGTVSLYLDPGASLSTIETGDHQSPSLITTLAEAYETGIAGFRFPEKAKSISVLDPLLVAESLAPNFTLFVPSPGMKTVAYPQNINLLVELQDSREIAEESISKHLANGTQTSVGLFDTCYLEQDAIGVATNVASLIDKGGCSFVWLCPNEDDFCEDNMIELVEQLSYLDVVGPTVKSRLVVRAGSEDLVEECLDLGVNKLAVHNFDKSSLDELRNIIEQKGKRLVSGHE
mmetsp:Transcript_12642/g.19602  ORF Transcript_12642/g.19602 Transcript_12642/m.19602 type:complete len:283 (-) Transcript_12642:258-1106(-)